MVEPLQQTLVRFEVRKSLGQVDGTMVCCQFGHHCENGGADVRQLALDIYTHIVGVQERGVVSPIDLEWNHNNKINEPAARYSAGSITTLWEGEDVTDKVWAFPFCNRITRSAEAMVSGR